MPGPSFPSGPRIPPQEGRAIPKLRDTTQPITTEQIVETIVRTMLAQLQQAALNIDSVFNLAVISDPVAFALVVPTTGVQVTPDADQGTLLYENRTQVPVCVLVRAETIESGSEFFLYLAGDGNQTNAGQAPGVSFSAQPVQKMLLLPGQALYGAMTAENGDTTARAILVTAIPLRGRALIFPEGT